MFLCANFREVWLSFGLGLVDFSVDSRADFSGPDSGQQRDLTGQSVHLSGPFKRTVRSV